MNGLKTKLLDSRISPLYLQVRFEPFGLNPSENLCKWAPRLSSLAIHADSSFSVGTATSWPGLLNAELIESIWVCEAGNPAFSRPALVSLFEQRPRLARLKLDCNLSFADTRLLLRGIADFVSTLKELHIAIDNYDSSLSQWFGTEGQVLRAALMANRKTLEIFNFSRFRGFDISDLVMVLCFGISEKARGDFESPVRLPFVELDAKCRQMCGVSLASISIRSVPVVFSRTCIRTASVPAVTGSALLAMTTPSDSNRAGDPNADCICEGAMKIMERALECQKRGDPATLADLRSVGICGPLAFPMFEKGSQRAIYMVNLGLELVRFDERFLSSFVWASAIHALGSFTFVEALLRGENSSLLSGVNINTESVLYTAKRQATPIVFRLLRCPSALDFIFKHPKFDLKCLSSSSGTILDHFVVELCLFGSGVIPAYLDLLQLLLELILTSSPDSIGSLISSCRRRTLIRLLSVGKYSATLTAVFTGLKIEKGDILAHSGIISLKKEHAAFRSAMKGFIKERFREPKAAQ